MKLFNIFQAYEPMQRLSKWNLPYTKSRALLQIKRTIEPDAQFYAAEEMKLAERFARKNENGRVDVNNGKISFDTKTQANEYVKKLEELREMAVDLSITPVRVTDKEIGEQSISAEDIERLKDFIEFGDD